jgi:cbb3-type cytochrome oxidase maturation protein
MSIIFIMIPLTLVLVGFGCWAFFWAVGAGQFDELDAPAWEILSDDAAPPGAAAPATEPSTQPPTSP